MALNTKPWTRSDLDRLPPDGNRYEVLDGRLLVTPQASLPHQCVAAEFTAALRVYVRRLMLAHVVGPGAVPFGQSELQPDVQVIPGQPGAARWEDAPPPLLVVEVLSRSSQRYDRGIKLDAYLQRAGVGTVWLEDHHSREVRIHEASGAARTEREILSWHPEGAPEPLTIDLPRLFREALGG